MTKVCLKTNHGTIRVELYEDKAPITVQNFLKYIKEGFYDNTLFHRVIDGFMIQGGGFDTAFTQKENHGPIQNEATNKLSNKRGTIAMARTSEPHSASSQFFINLCDNDFLDFQMPSPQGFGYCVFGMVTEGFNVIDKIAKEPTTSRKGHGDVPENDVILEEATLEE